MPVPFSDLQAVAPSAIIELFELQLSAGLHGSNEVWRFHAGSNLNANGELIWNGNTYLRFPVEVEGFEYNGRGQLPRPTLRVANVLSTVSAILAGVNTANPGNNLAGARLTRIRTLARYIDAANFPPRRNLLLRSAEFDNSYWTKTRTSVVVNDAIGPLGAQTADRLVEDTSASTSHLIQRSVAGFIAAAPYTFSIYARPAGRSIIRLDFGTVAVFGQVAGAVFDLSKGEVASNFGGAFADIRELGNGWYRCRITATTEAAGTSTVRLFTQATTGTVNYTGDGTSGVLIDAAQLEQDVAPSEYQPIAGSFSQNPLGTPDPTAEFPREIYFVDRKTKENAEMAEFELAAAFDLAGVRAPKRQCISNICQWVYRSAECGYTGSAYFNANDNPVGSPAQDVCGKRLNSCRARFGFNAELPFGSFPGIGTFFA
jgi:phage-related protein